VLPPLVEDTIPTIKVETILRTHLGPVTKEAPSNQDTKALTLIHITGVLHQAKTKVPGTHLGGEAEVITITIIHAAVVNIDHPALMGITIKEKSESQDITILITNSKMLR